MISNELLEKSPTRTEVLSEIDKRKRDRQRRLIERDADAIRHRCRTLPGFIKEAWHVLEPSTPYVHNWHIDAVAAHLQAITDREITRLQINQPPGTMKSLEASVFWPAYEWGPCKLPGLRYLSASYTDTYAHRDARKMRDLVQSEWYQTLWPEVVLIRDAEADFENVYKGGRKAVPMKSLTAGRGNRVIIDDPHSTETAESAAERKRAVRIFRESVPSRLNDKIHDAIMLIMHRLHTHDICGAIEAFGMDYVKLILPMEYDPKVVHVTKWFTDPRTQEGELLDPEREPRESIEKTKKEMTAHAYATQYQQRAAAREGGLFKRINFKIVDAAPAEADVEVRAWDLAATVQEDGNDPDWTVGLKMAKTNENRYYVKDVQRMRESAWEVRKAIKNCGSTDGQFCEIVVPKDPGQAGKAQSQSLIAENAGSVISAESESGDKATRAEPFAAQVEAGNVYLVRGPWNEAFIEELCTFPQGHDDQVDAASAAFNKLAEKEPLFDYKWV